MSDRQGALPSDPDFCVPSNTTSLKRMQKRNNMFLVGPVAAVLVFITFIGALTTVRGFEIKGGDCFTIVTQKGAFILFILSDTCAFCCSMLVLFCLSDAMVCSPEDPKALVLIDRGVALLKESLYATMMAFMVGTVAMTTHSMLTFVTFVMIVVAFVFPTRIRGGQQRY